MDGQRDRQDRHESPVGVQYNPEGNYRRDGSLVDNRPLYGPHNGPETVIQAVMESRPGEEPRVSLEETDTAWMDDLLALLTPKERVVIELVVFGQMSLSEAGKWLGAEYGRKPYSKQGVSNIRDAALAKLRGSYADAASG